jgi:very-short-patch-repair endonuclease
VDSRIIPFANIFTVKPNMKNNFYNKKNQSFANYLRKNMTKAEACLWKYALRAGRMKGYCFRRQRPVMGFIADFMCFELKLIIEVDGYSHLLDETIDKDQIKNASLEKYGYTVMRIRDEEVLCDIDNVIQRIERYVEEFEKGRQTAIHPLPPHRLRVAATAEQGQRGIVVLRREIDFTFC